MFKGPPEDNRANSRRRLRVTVLCGGPSAEREISLESGRAVAAALERCGHAVHIADVGPDHLEALDHPADVIFPALHGTFGEDGTVQRLMEERGIPYVGSDSRASALAMDKVLSKHVVAQDGFCTPAYEIWDDRALDNRAQPDIPLPIIVKPVDQGSSVATTIVHDPGDFLPAASRAIEAFGRALVEQFIAGDELTVGIIGDVALPPICVRPMRTFYDYEAKYRDDATEYLFDTGHGAPVLERVQAQSRRVFELMNCRHLARIDWMCDQDHELWFLEVNTLPGFTDHSLVPKAAARVGIPFDELVDRLVRMPCEDTP